MQHDAAAITVDCGDRMTTGELAQRRTVFPHADDRRAWPACPNHTAGYPVSDAVPARLGNQHPNVAPYGVFPVGRGKIVLACGTDAQWRSLCAGVGHSKGSDDVHLRENNGRVRHRDDVTDLLADWFSTWDGAVPAAELNAVGVAAAPINSVPDVLNHPQVEALGLLVDVVDGDGSVRLVGNPLRMSSLPGTRVTLVVFSPGARSWWHSHDEGQVIYVVSGLGLITTKEPGSARQIRAGDTVIVPPHEPHWHGAMRNSFLLHLTVNTGNYHHTHWLGEEVSANDCEAAHR
jgi:quercetin dioxygenase-like cupin family protein